MVIIKFCKNCDRLFTTYLKTQNFCSWKCFLIGRDDVWNKNKKMSKSFGKKISELNFKRFKDPMQRLKISLTHKRGDHDRGYKKQSKTLKKKYESGDIIPWNKGLTINDDKRLIQSEESKIKRSIISKKKWEDPEYRHKVITRSLKALFGKRPTNLEIKFIQLIKKYNLPFKYIGDGKLIIGGCNPDFISTNKRKLIIEVANKIHHPDNYEVRRYAIFAKFGYRTCTIWGPTFRDKNWESNIIKLLIDRNFIESKFVSVGLL